MEVIKILAANKMRNQWNINLNHHQTESEIFSDMWSFLNTELDSAPTQLRAKLLLGPPYEQGIKQNLRELSRQTD